MISPLSFYSSYQEIARIIAIALLISISIVGALHVLLSKRNPRSALGWFIVCLALPGFGVIFYFLLGLNRIEIKAKSWKQKGRWLKLAKLNANDKIYTSLLKIVPSHEKEFIHNLYQISNAVIKRPLVDGCQVEVLWNGEQAYSAMLEAIDEAKYFILFSSYIFEANKTGKAFIKALGEAKKRGVDVRVILDGVGVFYSWIRAKGLFKKMGIKAHHFLPLSFSKWGLYVNLRNHRKILVVDNRVGFTGGINVSDRHLVLQEKKKPILDIHFRLFGPILEQLTEAFLEDWFFITKKKPGRLLTEKMTCLGTSYCRAITSGPNEDLEKVKWVVLGAVAYAKKSVKIMTPYLIPDDDIISTFALSAMKGTKIEIILPQKSDIPLVDWASRAYLGELIQHGIKIYYQPLPFCHGKLLVVDELFSLIGSSNLDPRSFRLNFEFNVEIYNPELARYLTDEVDQIIARSKLVTKNDLKSISLGLRVRNSFAKLFSPYL